MPNVFPGALVLGFLSWKALTDPIGYLGDKFRDAYEALSGYAQTWIFNPPHPAPGPWLDYLKSNSLGLAVAFLLPLGLISLFAMVTHSKFAPMIVRVSFVAVLMAGLAGYWLNAGNLFDEATHDFIISLSANPVNPKQLFFLPDIHNGVGAMFGCLFLLIGAGLLIAIFFLYEILLVIVTVIGLPLAALSPLGSWFRYKFEQMFALLIVTSFFGRMAAVLIISWGTQVAVHMPGLDNAFGEVLSLLVTLAFAIYTQWWLLKKADKIYGNVTNRSLGVQKVTGRVESMFRSSERRTSDQAQIQTAHINSLSPALVSNPISRLRFSGSTSVNTFTRPVSAPVASSLSRSRRAWNSIRKTNS